MKRERQRARWRGKELPKKERGEGKERKKNKIAKQMEGGLMNKIKGKGEGSGCERVATTAAAALRETAGRGGGWGRRKECAFRRRDRKPEIKEIIRREKEVVARER